MASSDETDLFMTLTDQDGDPVGGDSRTDFSAGGGASNPLMAGFSTGFVFEIQSFRFGASGDGNPQDPAVGTKGLDDLPPAIREELLRARVFMATMQKQVKQTAQNQTQTVGQGNKDKPPVGDVTFSRMIDSTSVPIMQNLIDRGWYQQCSIVKRKAAGGPAAGEAYLRVDFDDVLFKNVAWNDAERVTENVTFICRGVTMQYRPQLPDGSLGPIISGEWSMDDPDSSC